MKLNLQTCGKCVGISDCINEINIYCSRGSDFYSPSDPCSNPNKDDDCGCYYLMQEDTTITDSDCSFWSDPFKTCPSGSNVVPEQSITKFSDNVPFITVFQHQDHININLNVFLIKKTF